jgi:hypothetical protein
VTHSDVIDLVATGHKSYQETASSSLANLIPLPPAAALARQQAPLQLDLASTPRTYLPLSIDIAITAQPER